MQARWQMLKDKWAALAVREQQMLAGGGAVLAVLLMYVGIWSPYTRYVDELREKLKSTQQTLAWMKMADETISAQQQNVQAKQAVKTPAVMLSVLQKEVVKAGLQQRMKLLKQAAQDSVQLQFQKVDFDQLTAFLIDVAQHYAVVVTQLSATSTSASGIVDAEVIVKPLEGSSANT